MKIPWKRVLMTVPILIGAFVVVLWALSYHTFEFKGGIGVRDSGFFSYPRYHAQLGHFLLLRAGEYQFAVHGLPSGPLNLALEVSGITYTQRAELTSLATTVSVSITDASGKELCSASGRLSDSKLRGLGSWVLESSSSRSAFWHPACENLPISRFRTYAVKVTLSAVDPHSPDTQLTPILEGGGTELP